MYAKIRISNAVNSSYTINDIVAALFETQATNMTQLLAGVNAATASVIDVANSFISTSKSGHGWTVDYSNGSNLQRTLILKSACRNSEKFKYALLAAGSTAQASVTTGSGRSGNVLSDSQNIAQYYSTSLISTSTITEIHVSSSARHLFLTTMRIDTQASLSCGVFEFVTNDGYYTESSPYVPVVQMFEAHASVNFASNSRCLRMPRYKNMRANGYPDVTSQMCYWETPYSEDDFNPADNSGYDYLGVNTDRTPILQPFGVCNKTLHGFMGGAISDLCDIYLGPTNVGGNFEETLIGTDPYMSIPINNATKRFFVPKG